MSTNNVGRILVIEDNRANRELMVYLLKAFSYPVVEASDGQAGIDTVRRERPDLVVCDVQLPVIDGYGVVRNLKDDPELRRIPVVAVTALAMVGDRDRILAAGFDGYIAKPIEPQTFVETVTCFLPFRLRSPDQRILSPHHRVSSHQPVPSKRKKV